MGSAGGPGRRTQAERMAVSRRELLDAAADCLVDEGLSGLTIARVAERAGMSTGAVFHHFGDKASLVVALAEHLSAEMEEHFAADLPDTDDAVERAVGAVEAIAGVWRQPRSKASLELYTASRTDPGLGAALARLNAIEADQHAESARYHFDDERLDPGRRQALADLAIYAVIGMATVHLPAPDAGAERRVVALLKELAGEAAGSGGGPIRTPRSGADEEGA